MPSFEHVRRTVTERPVRRAASWLPADVPVAARRPLAKPLRGAAIWRPVPLSVYEMRQTSYMRTLEAERILARRCVGSLDRRWSHVKAVGRTAEQLAKRTELVSDDVVRAAWLHDVGYGLRVRSTGFHALDGARFLAAAGVEPTVVSLVAFHTGAIYEADERGLTAELYEFSAPDPDDLDVLTMIDLGVGPDGVAIVDVDRLAEVLNRYGTEDPVSRAVQRSMPSLLAASSRSKDRLELPDDWPIGS